MQMWRKEGSQSSECTGEKRNLCPEEIRAKAQQLIILKNAYIQNQKIGMFVPALTDTYSSTVFCASP